MTDISAPRTARARARAELTVEIKRAARRQLAEHGSAALSLRAVARELGMVSSAVYRYFPSRDELLTALIVDAYRAVSASALEAESAVRRTDLAGRWIALCRASRQWALTHPHEFALIFGSPVPGYQAPPDTIDPAAQIPLLLIAILRDADHAGRVPAVDHGPLPKPVRGDLRRLRDELAPGLPERYLAGGVMAWAQLIGMISFELFGHLHNAITDFDAHFDYQMKAVARDLGLS